MNPSIKANAKSVRLLLASITAELAAVEAGKNVNLDDAVADAAMACNKLCLLRFEIQRKTEDDGK